MGNYCSIQLVGGLSDKDMAGKKRMTITRELADGRKVPITCFESMQDVTDAMDLVDPETGKNIYHSNPAFRETVKDLMAVSPKVMAEPTLARRSVIPTNEEFLKGLKRDALIQRRNELVEKAGGNDAIAKLTMAEALMTPEFAEAAYEMEAATEVATPYADMLKQRKEQGLGPLQWNYAVDADRAIAPSEDQLTSSEPIITMEN